MKNIFRVAVVLVLSAAVVAAVLKVREKQRAASEAAEDIEARLGELDPITRAAVVTKLGKDAARSVRSR